MTRSGRCTTNENQRCRFLKRMAHLALDRRGFPIPPSVYIDTNGRPRHFTINDEPKRQALIATDRCPLCGGKLLRGRWFVGGPQSAFHNPWCLHRPADAHRVRALRSRFARISPRRTTTSGFDDKHLATGRHAVADRSDHDPGAAGLFRRGDDDEAEVDHQQHRYGAVPCKLAGPTAGSNSGGTASMSANRTL